MHLQRLLLCHLLWAPLLLCKCGRASDSCMQTCLTLLMLLHPQRSQSRLQKLKHQIKRITHLCISVHVEK
jgi:hypothetical protein